MIECSLLFRMYSSKLIKWIEIVLHMIEWIIIIINNRWNRADILIIDEWFLFIELIWVNI
jgi:hypothetical protein